MLPLKLGLALMMILIINLTGRLAEGKVPVLRSSNNTLSGGSGKSFISKVEQMLRQYKEENKRTGTRRSKRFKRSQRSKRSKKSKRCKKSKRPKRSRRSKRSKKSKKSKRSKKSRKSRKSRKSKKSRKSRKSKKSRRCKGNRRRKWETEESEETEEPEVLFYDGELKRRCTMKAVEEFDEKRDLESWFHILYCSESRSKRTLRWEDNSAENRIEMMRNKRMSGRGDNEKEVHFSGSLRRR